MSGVRTVVWRGVDDPDRIDSARFTFSADSLRASGQSVTAQYRLWWSLSTTAGWLTERLHADVVGDGWHRRLDLTRMPDGSWHAQAFRAGEGGPDTDPGVVDLDALAGATDIDLGLCPATNTMPILRMGLPQRAPRAPRDVLVAWVDVPSLAVHPSPQRYGPASRRKSGLTVRFTSLDDGFTADLPIDSDGLVGDYPDLARRA